MTSTALRDLRFPDLETAIVEEPLSLGTRLNDGSISEELLRVEKLQRQQMVARRGNTSNEEAEKGPSTLAHINQTSLQPTQSIRLAEWDGYVTEIDDGGNFFYASLKGIFGDGVKGEEEDATIPTEDLSDGDRELLMPGNYFRLCIIRQKFQNGESQRSTRIVFRRLPAYRREDLEAAVERGRELARGLRVE